MTNKKIIKINLGAGPDGISSWRNFDWGLLPFLAKTGLLKAIISCGFLTKDYDRLWPKFDLVDIRKGIPMNDNSVDFVYCSHVLEHFEKWESVKVVREIRRVLKRGGLVRLVMPDVKKIVKIKDVDELCRVWWGYDKDKIKGIKKMFARGHQWLFSFDSFKKMLTRAGFKKIKKMSYGQGKVPDLEKLDLLVHKNLSFYVEVEK